MILSLNEVESLVLKAARGAGLAWGLAEEAAAAAVWLARVDLLLLAPFVARLRAVGSTSQPVVEGQILRPSTVGTTLCPILTGAFIADLGSGSRIIEVRDVLAPLWLAAVVVRSLSPESQLIAEWHDARLVLGSGGPHGPINSGLPGMSAEASGTVSLVIGPRAEGHHTPSPRPTSGIMVRDACLQALQFFERRTFVPASERSRLAGAGAGLLDGD